MKNAISALSLGVAGLLSGFMAWSSAHAAAVLDQAMEQSGGGQAFGRNNTNGQTFTVGVPGVLGRFDAYLSNRADVQTLLLNVYGTENGLPDRGALLGSKTFTVPSDGTYDGASWKSFDVESLNIAAAAGDVLAMELTHSVFSGLWSWTLASGDPYADGLKFNWVHWSGTPVLEIYPDMDNTFRTFMVTSIPEPGTYALLLAGLGVLGFVARRRATTGR